jgi:hypothetical protein
MRSRSPCRIEDSFAGTHDGALTDIGGGRCSPSPLARDAADEHFAIGPTALERPPLVSRHGRGGLSDGREIDIGRRLAPYSFPPTMSGGALGSTSILEQVWLGRKGWDPCATWAHVEPLWVAGAPVPSRIFRQPSNIPRKLRAETAAVRALTGVYPKSRLNAVLKCAGLLKQ